MEPAAAAADYSVRLAVEIRALLARQGRTQENLAKSIGIARTSMTNKLTGRSEFTVGELDAIAREFGLTISELLYRVEVAA